eukprot:scaffold4022_cov122-Isochrysis_galbana.AAC.6
MWGGHHLCRRNQLAAGRQPPEVQVAVSAGRINYRLQDLACQRQLRAVGRGAAEQAMRRAGAPHADLPIHAGRQESADLASICRVGDGHAGLVLTALQHLRFHLARLKALHVDGHFPLDSHPVCNRRYRVPVQQTGPDGHAARRVPQGGSKALFAADDCVQLRHRHDPLDAAIFPVIDPKQHSGIRLKVHGLDE